jgi:CRISPR-associated protein Cas2
MPRVVIVYDIISNKRRKRVSDLLEGYGKRVNRSVFECQFKTLKIREKLTKELLMLLNPKVDSLRIYTICQNCMLTSQGLCDEPQPFVNDTIYWY